MKLICFPTRRLDESFLWFLDVKPITALVIHMAKTSLRHYQMFHITVLKLSFHMSRSL